MNTQKDIAVEEELNRLSEQIQSILDNLDKITEDDIDPELLALAKQVIERNNSTKLTPKEVAEKFFPDES